MAVRFVDGRYGKQSPGGLIRVRPEMVDFGSEQGLSDFSRKTGLPA